MTAQEILVRFKSQANPDKVKGMAQYEINTEKAFGISMPALRKMGKETGKDHALALELWNTGYHEARILASLIADPKHVTEELMEEWVLDFNSWDLCDQVCMNLFDKTSLAYKKALEWSARKEEFVKRAGFALMARLAWTDKKAHDDKFLIFLPIIREEAIDERNFVKKAVNWALRQIGKRNKQLNKYALEEAEILKMTDSKSARWIGNDAYRELTSKKIKNRLKD